MDDFPFAPLLAGAAILLVGPLRRRALAAAGAVGRTGIGVAAATVMGSRDVVLALARGEDPHGAHPPGHRADEVGARRAAST